MATNASITFNWGSLPPGYEPTDANDFVSQLAKIVTGYLSGSYTAFNFGSTTPAAEDQDKPWFRTTATGEFDRVYSYSSTYGKWVSPHTIPAEDKRLFMFYGSSAEVDTLDGGTAGTASVSAGPFWEIHTALAAKFPVGVGAFATAGTVSVTGSTTDLSVSGVDKHTLTVNEMPTHSHVVPSRSSSDSDSGGDYYESATGSLNDQSAEFSTEDEGDGNPHNNLPPFYGVYFIRRTVRAYHTVT